MKRYLVATMSALMIIAPLAVSNLGHSQAQETPAKTEEKGKGDVEAGKELYTANCKKCHAPGGEGVPRMYKLVKASVVHLGSKQAQQKSDEDIRKSMTDGFGKMEPVPELTSENIDNIVAFVRTLKEEPPK